MYSWIYLVAAIVLTWHGSMGNVILGNNCAAGDVQNRQVFNDCRECTCRKLFLVSYWKCEQERCKIPAPELSELQVLSPPGDLSSTTSPPGNSSNPLELVLDLTANLKESANKLSREADKLKKELEEKIKELENAAGKGRRRKRELHSEADSTPKSTAHSYEDQIKEIAKQAQNLAHLAHGLVEQCEGTLINANSAFQSAANNPQEEKKILKQVEEMNGRVAKEINAIEEKLTVLRRNMEKIE